MKDFWNKLSFDHLFDSVNWAIEKFCKEILYKNCFRREKCTIYYNGFDNKRENLLSIEKEFSIGDVKFGCRLSDIGYWIYRKENECDIEFIQFYNFEEVLSYES